MSSSTLDPLLAFEELSQAFPDVAAQLRQSLDSGAKPKRPDYSPGVFKIYYDGSCVLTQKGGVTEEQEFPPDYTPTFIFFYGDDELLLVSVKRCILLNLLPKRAKLPAWKTYTYSS